MYTKMIIPAAVGAALFLGGPAAYAADLASQSWMQPHLYLEYQKYPHAQPLPQVVAYMNTVNRQTAALESTAARSFDSPAASPDRTVSIGGENLAASAVVGTPVLTPAGERLGKVARVSGDGSTSEVVISLDDENHQPKVDPEKPAKLPGKAGAEPVVVGGPSAVVASDSMRRGDDGASLVIEQSSVRPIDRKYT